MNWSIREAKALEIWTGKKAPVDVMERAVLEALAVRQAGQG
jgi:shikimate 5-dehydrogenase